MGVVFNSDPLVFLTRLLAPSPSPVLHSGAWERATEAPRERPRGQFFLFLFLSLSLSLSPKPFWLKSWLEGAILSLPPMSTMR